MQLNLIFGGEKYIFEKQKKGQHNNIISQERKLYYTPYLNFLGKESMYFKNKGDVSVINNIIS